VSSRSGGVSSRSGGVSSRSGGVSSRSGGVSSRSGEAAVYAGQFLGWVHKPAAWIGRRPWGKGQLVVTTFRLQGEDKLANPTAAALLDGLIELGETYSP
jgi:hypothetical protein